MSEIAAESGGLRRQQVVSLALGALALTAVLMVLRFPYDRVALAIAKHVEQQTGARITFGPVSLSLVRFGPGISAQGVQIARPDGTRLDFDRLGVRPALALAWLRG